MSIIKNEMNEKIEYCPNCKSLKKMNYRLIKNYIEYSCLSCDNIYVFEKDKEDYKIFNYKSQRFNILTEIDKFFDAENKILKCSCGNDGDLRINKSGDFFTCKCNICNENIKLDPNNKFKILIEDINELEKNYSDLTYNDKLFHLIKVELLSYNFRIHNEDIEKFISFKDSYTCIDENDKIKIENKIKKLNKLIENEKQKVINIKKVEQEKKELKELKKLNNKKFRKFLMKFYLVYLAVFSFLISLFFTVYKINPELISYLLPKYTVTVFLPDRESPLEINVVKGTKIKNLQSKLGIEKIVDSYYVDEKTETIFNGKINESITLYVSSFVKKNLTLINGEDVYEVISCEVGEIIELPICENDNQKEFKGWFYNGLLVTTIKMENEDISLIAGWDYKKYTATFIADGEKVGEATFTVVDDVINNTPVVPEKLGYTGEWETYEIGQNDIVINAVYTPNKYVINLDYNGATVTENISYIEVIYGCEIPNLPIPTMNDHHFEGWFYNDELFDKVNYDITEDITIVARFNYYSGGNGTIDDPYLISSLQEFENIKYNMSCHFKLVSDLDLFSYVNWNSIGYNSDKNTYADFTGTFDGDFHTISNLKRQTVVSLEENNNGKLGYFGLFAKLAGNAVVKNLFIKDVDFAYDIKNFEGYAYVGSVAGLMTGYSSIENVVVYGRVSINENIDWIEKKKSYLYLGGIVGYAKDFAKINYCGNKINLYSVEDFNWTGGIVGYVSSSNVQIMYCYNNADIVGKRFSDAGVDYFSTFDEIGGIVGKIEEDYSCMIQHCYNSGVIDSGSKRVNNTWFEGSGKSRSGALVGDCKNANNSNTIKNNVYVNENSACGSDGKVGTNKECSSEDIKYALNVIDYMGVYISEEDLKINSKNCWIFYDYGINYPKLWFEE